MVLGEGSKSKCILDIALNYCGSFPSRARYRNFLGQRVFFLGTDAYGSPECESPGLSWPFVVLLQIDVAVRHKKRG